MSKEFEAAIKFLEESIEKVEDLEEKDDLERALFVLTVRKAIEPFKKAALEAKKHVGKLWLKH
jgi:hypothetical protein